VPLSEATTPSLEALSTYASALKAYNEQGVQAALALDQHAIELDPSFAMAHYDVGDDYFSLNQLGRASQYYTKAFELRQHANDRSKLLITGNYYSTVTGEHVTREARQRTSALAKSMPPWDNMKPLLK
jgi:tetratricopeptide (TPR) repeat protein